MAPSGEAESAHPGIDDVRLGPRRLAVVVGGAASSRARASVTAHISERRTSSLGSGPCSASRLSVFDAASRTAMNEAGRAHTIASIRPRSCPSMSGRQHALQPVSDELEIGQ